jgi:hypothetical protein
MAYAGQVLFTVRPKASNETLETDQGFAEARHEEESGSEQLSREPGAVAQDGCKPGKGANWLSKLGR